METNNRLVEHYDNKYRNFLEDLPQKIRITPYPRDRFEMTAYYASRNAGGRYLEIGAGSGNTLYTLLDCYDELIATELSSVRAQSMDKIFKELTNNKVQIINNNIEQSNLDFPDGYFDTIVMNAVIEHLVDPVRVLKELHRLTKESGRVIIGTPNIAKYTRRIKLLLGYFPSTASIDEGLLCYDGIHPTDLHDEGHLHYFTYRSLAKILRDRACFSRVDYLGYGIPLLSGIWPQLFSDDVFLIAYK